MLHLLELKGMTRAGQDLHVSQEYSYQIIILKRDAERLRLAPRSQNFIGATQRLVTYL